MAAFEVIIHKNAFVYACAACAHIISGSWKLVCKDCASHYLSMCSAHCECAVHTVQRTLCTQAGFWSTPNQDLKCWENMLISHVRTCSSSWLTTFTKTQWGLRCGYAPTHDDCCVEMICFNTIASLIVAVTLTLWHYDKQHIDTGDFCPFSLSCIPLSSCPQACTWERLPLKLCQRNKQRKTGSVSKLQIIALSSFPLAILGTEAWFWEIVWSKTELSLK